MGSPAWTTDPRYEALAARITHQDELERRISEWTRPQVGSVLQQRLLEAGVPGGVAYPALDLLEDPHLRHRDHFVALDHAEMGVWKYDELGFKLPDSPSRLQSAAPLIGEHNERVLKEFLGYSDAEYQALVDAGALQ
jgi:benzylsuccinate CoA-transferase BbsF subunit